MSAQLNYASVNPIAAAGATILAHTTAISSSPDSNIKSPSSSSSFTSSLTPSSSSHTSSSTVAPLSSSSPPVVSSTASLSSLLPLSDSAFMPSRASLLTTSSHQINTVSPATALLAQQVEAEKEKEAIRLANLAAETLKAKRPQLTDLNAPTPPKPSLPLPGRFRDPKLYDRDPTAVSSLAALEVSGGEQQLPVARERVVQHPLYRTSGASYGSRPPALPELPTVYFGNSHTFSNTFAGGMYRDNGLNTALNKSRVEQKTEFGYI